MTISFQEAVNTDRLEQGETLQAILNDLEPEKKNAIVAFRCVNKTVPDSVDNEDLRWVEFKSSIDTLAIMGFCYVNEEETKDLLVDFKQEIGECLYSDHRAWSMLTVLEAIDYKNCDSHYLEANIFLEKSKINPEKIDLVCESEEIELITCKFNIATQRQAARKKAKELREVAKQLDVRCSICLATLNPKVKQRIVNEMGDSFDEIISGVDILDFE